MSEDTQFGVAFCFFVAVFIFIGFIMGRSHAQATYREEAVQRGFAEYNATTGEWQWKGNSNADR